MDGFFSNATTELPFGKVLTLMLLFFPLFLLIPLALCYGIFEVARILVSKREENKTLTLVENMLFALQKPKANKVDMCLLGCHAASYGYTMTQYCRKFFNRNPKTLTDNEIKAIINGQDINESD